MKPKPRIHITCIRCGRTTTAATGSTVGDAVKAWYAHRWWRPEVGVHVCERCHREDAA